MGRIHVSAERAGESLILKVSDDGVGMDALQLQQLRDSLSSVPQHMDQSGFGIINVAERIKLYYGADYGLDIDSVQGEGTVFTVRLPLLKENNESTENKNIQENHLDG